MKHILLLLTVFFLFGATAVAQDLSKKSKQELEQMKTQAVKEQNFQLAENIKTELNSRKSIDDQIAEKKNELYEAAKKGDLARAEELRNEVQRLETAKGQIAILEEQLKIAVKQEQYGEAQQLKLQIENLKNPVAAPAPARKTVGFAPKKAPETTAATNNTTPVTADAEPETKKRWIESYRPALGFTLGFPNFKSESGNALSTNFSPTVGYKFGLGKDFPIADNLLVQPEVAFLSMGFKVADQDYNYNMYYLSLQGTAQYKTPFKASVGLGIFLDYGLFGTQSYPSGDKGKIFENGGLVRLNTGLNFEAGYPVAFAPVTGDIFFSYRKALNNSEDNDATEGQTTKLNMVTIGYRYTF